MEPKTARATLEEHGVAEVAHVEDRRWSIDRETGERTRTAYRGPNPWQLRYRTNEGKARRQAFRTKAEADRQLAEVEHRRNTGALVDPARGRTKFGDRYTTWFDTTVNLRASTRARDESYARSLILPTFNDVQLVKIDHDLVQRWIAELIRAGKAPATVHRAHQIVSMVMQSAVKARLIAQNPCDESELPRIEREEQRFLTPAEVARLVDAIDERYRVWVLTAAYSGLRAGELYGLRRSRLDLLRASIDVAEILVEVKGHHHYGPPKTRKGRRVVPIPRFVADELTTYVADLEPTALVFTAPGGGPMRASLFRRRIWHPACVAAGLGHLVPVPGTDKQRYEGLRIHDLRHTAVAFLDRRRREPQGDRRPRRTHLRRDRARPLRPPASPGPGPRHRRPRRDGPHGRPRGDAGLDSRPPAIVKHRYLTDRSGSVPI